MKTYQDEMAAVTRAMWGVNSIHVPFHGVVQRMGCDTVKGSIPQNEEVVICLFASKVKAPHPLLFGHGEQHSFVHGDMVIRPMNAFVSNHCTGMGASGILTSSSFCDTSEWVEKGKIVMLNGELK